jgi:archaellum component FlaC
MPEWIFMEILKAVTPLIIGAGVIYIAWQQHKTNKDRLTMEKDRLKMERFDRRYKIYEAMVELVTTEIITTDDMQKYAIKTAQARFVFKRDIQDALAKVGIIGNRIAQIMEEYPSIVSSHEIFCLRTQDTRLDDLYNNLYKAADDASNIFAEYITLKL